MKKTKKIEIEKIRNINEKLDVIGIYAEYLLDDKYDDELKAHMLDRIMDDIKKVRQLMD